jgi:hypothetical protein
VIEPLSQSDRANFKLLLFRLTGTRARVRFACPNIRLGERNIMSTELACQRERTMPITPFFDGLKIDPEAKRIMGVAFEMTCAARKYTNQPYVPDEAVAKRIIELAKNGVRDPDRLCERVLDDLRKLPRTL